MGPCISIPARTQRVRSKTPTHQEGTHSVDKLYKTHFLSQVKARMALERPEFQLRKVPRDHKDRWLFSSSLLYVHKLPSDRFVWLDWMPGDGVERDFFVHLGWSYSADQLPVNQPGDKRIHFIREPSAELASGTLNIQAVEGRNAIAGFQIPTPWDELYNLSPRAPEIQRQTIMHKAHAAYLALSDIDRIEATRSALNEAFACLASVLPRFKSVLNDLHRIDT